MKTFVRRPSLKVFLAAFFPILLLLVSFIFFEKQVERRQIQSFVSRGNVREQTLAIESQKENPGFPVRLKIPSINLDANVKSVGVTTGGAMGVPVNATDVGWYKFGPGPGEKGSAVISGHFDEGNGAAAVFNNLNKLKTGDKIAVINNLGKTITFVVRESRLYDPGYANEVFLPNDKGTHLNLVTCDGVWDGFKKSYTKRLVVFADML